MHISAACVILIVTSNAIFAMPAYPTYVEVHEMQELGMPPRSPMDPAVHSFPKDPTAPLIPNCQKQGYYRDPFNCAKFYHCEHDRAIPIAFYCQSGRIFDTHSNTCEIFDYVKC